MSKFNSFANTNENKSWEDLKDRWQKKEISQENLREAMYRTIIYQLISGNADISRLIPPTLFQFILEDTECMNFQSCKTNILVQMKRLQLTTYEMAQRDVKK